MTSEQKNLTVEEFIENLEELPEQGRWAELHSGEILVLEPPDDVHGNVIYHLSPLIAESILEQQKTSNQMPGYACFSQGLIVSKKPDTVQFPPISFFVTENLFETSDDIVTEKCPELIIEIASTPLRRKQMESRVQNYFDLGTKIIWIIDTVEKQIKVSEKGSSSSNYSGDEIVKIPEFLPQLSVQVSTLFKDPDWYK